MRPSMFEGVYPPRGSAVPPGRPVPRWSWDGLQRAGAAPVRLDGTGAG